jgi:hypothetical protein
VVATRPNVMNLKRFCSPALAVLPYQCVKSHAPCLAVAGELSGGMGRKVRLDSRPRHRRGGSAAERDGLEDLTLARSLGIASRLAPGLRGRAGDKLPALVSSVAV